MPSPTILLGVRVVDPRREIDRVADVLIADGIVQRIEQPGSGKLWPEHPNSGVSGTRVISPAAGEEYLLTPGLVDCHTHVFGSAGVSRADALGVDVAIPSIIDAGGAGAATIDDFVSLRAKPSRTQIYSLMSIESGGITDRHITHNTTRSAQEMVTSSIDAFLGAIDRHSDTVLGLKVWASRIAGLRWIDHGVHLSEMTSLPMMVHVGEDTSQAPDNTAPVRDNTARVEDPTALFTGDVLDRLQGGDVVTHSFTGLSGGLVNTNGKVAAEVTAARGRGVLFDVAPGLENLSFARATAAMESGWLPDTISSDANRWVIEQHSDPALLRVMGSFMALGLSLNKTIECASSNAADAFGITTGSPHAGETATLSLLALRQTPAIFSDGEKSIRGTETLAPIGCFIDGEWIAAGEQDETAYGATSADHPRFLAAIAEELTHHRSHDERWRGVELHQLVHRARRDSRLSISEAMGSFYAELGPSESTIPAGWLLEQLGPDETMRRLEGLQTS